MENKSIWEHLDDLKKVLVQMLIISLIFAIAAFFFKEQLFALLLAPQNSDFILYQWISQIGDKLGMPSMQIEPFSSNLINIELTAPFMIHMKVALYTGILISAPILIYKLFAYISPALYASEKRATLSVLPWAVLLFYCGIILNYLIIFPVSYRFLATYTVSDTVVNTISLSSYISTFTILSIMMGIAFEIPIVCLLLSKMGILSGELLSKYRRHAFVIIMIIAAIITPTSDIFTLMIVTLPIYLLFELGILLSKTH